MILNHYLCDNQSIKEMDEKILLEKIKVLPDNLKAELIDFLNFLTSRNKESKQNGKPVFGSAKGMFVIHDDFDEPLKILKIIVNKYGQSS